MFDGPAMPRAAFPAAIGGEWAGARVICGVQEVEDQDRGQANHAEFLTDAANPAV